MFRHISPRWISYKRLHKTKSKLMKESLSFTVLSSPILARLSIGYACFFHNPTHRACLSCSRPTRWISSAYVGSKCLPAAQWHPWCLLSVSDESFLPQQGFCTRFFGRLDSHLTSTLTALELWKKHIDDEVVHKLMNALRDKAVRDRFVRTRLFLHVFCI